MTNYSELLELNKKIEAAKVENKAFDESINGANQPGGNWKESLIKNCGVTWAPNTPRPSCSTTQFPSKFICNGQINCDTIWITITQRTQKINENLANINIWQGQVDALMKDPNIVNEIKNRQTKNGVIITIVIVAVISIGLYLWKKYKK